MAVRFVVGRAGTGKTRRCVSRVAEAMREDPLGPPIYWLLPRQATFQAERDLTCASGLGGFCRARVLSFEQLSRDVLATAGGAAMPEVTALGRQMILGHLLRANQSKLRFFRSVARQPGLAADLDAVFGEFERCGRAAGELPPLLDPNEIADADNAAVQSLAPKLHDLALLHQQYAEFLGQERLDPHRRFERVLLSIDECALFTDAEIYIDGFADFTDHERRMIARLATAARQVEIMLLMDPASPLLENHHRNPDELSLFHRTEQAYRKLRAALQAEGAQIEPPLVLDEPRRFESAVLAQVEKRLFAAGEQRSCLKPEISNLKFELSDLESRNRQSAIGNSLLLLEAPDRRAEADAAARITRQWLRDGLRLRDIAVLTRRLEDYHELIDAAFREHGITCFIDRRRTAAHHPLLAFVRSALLIVTGNWRRDAVMSLIKSGLAGLSLDEADELENYVLLHRIDGAEAWCMEDDWSFRRTLKRRDDEDDEPTHKHVELRRINRLRTTVVEPLARFQHQIQTPKSTIQNPQPPLRHYVAELFALMEQFHVRQTIGRWMKTASEAGQLEAQAEHEQVWHELTALFDQVVDLLGDAPVTAEQFLEILDTGLEQFDLALTPPRVDEVLVGQIDRTRSPQVRAVVLLGMNEGVFPHVPRESSILSDAERATLSERQFDLEPDSRRRLLDENLLGYIAFTRAAERLVVTRAIADDQGRPMAPSIFWRRLRELLPQAPVETLRREVDDAPAQIGTSRQLAAWLMRQVRNPRDNPDGSRLHKSLYHSIASGGDGVAAAVRRAWPALRYDNAARLSPEVAARLFGSPLHASVTRIETFASCPFRHFARYGLKLEQREDEDVTTLDLGNVFHQVLERIVASMLQQRRDWSSLDAPAAAEMIRDYTREAGQGLRGELMLASAKNRYLLERIERTVGDVVASQRVAAQRCVFRPAFAELGFGLSDAKLPPFNLKTPRGNELLLYGKIDRVDLIADQAAFAVTDYKLTGRTLALEEVYHGMSLQLLTYLLVLEASGEGLVGRPLTPAAAFYLQLLRGLESVKHPDKAKPPDDPAFHLKIKPRGIFDGDYVHALDCTLEIGKSEVVSATIRQDGDFGKSGDVAAAEEFRALLQHVREKLAELGDQIIAGSIEVSPYRLKLKTPCSWCEFGSVCRFEPGVNRYHTLEPMKREEALRRISEEQSHVR